MLKIKSHMPTGKIFTNRSHLLRLLTVLLLTIFASGVKTTIAQGCSDAGFCTIGNLHQLTEASTKKFKQKISLLLPVGVGDERVVIFAPGIQYDHQLNSRWAIQTKLTANYANGSLASVAGVGDIFLSGIYTFKRRLGWLTSVLAGTKIPLNNSNLTNSGTPLPMQYQSSLGTVDLISGVSTSNEHLQFAAGWQQPLSGSNNNQFLPGHYNNPDSKNYPPSRNFNRKGDVLLRAGYSYRPSATLSLNGGLLAIYHLGEDSYDDSSNSTHAINGSGGLTLNVTLAASLKLNNSVSIGVTAGSPLVAREVRPDGLTRKFIVSPEISWNF